MRRIKTPLPYPAGWRAACHWENSGWRALPEHVYQTPSQHPQEPQNNEPAGPVSRIAGGKNVTGWLPGECIWQYESMPAMLPAWYSRSSRTFITEKRAQFIHADTFKLSCKNNGNKNAAARQQRDMNMLILNILQNNHIPLTYAFNKNINH